MFLKAAVIGLGFGRHHTKIYSEMEGIELVGVSDTNQDMKHIADKHHTIFTENYRDLLHADLDLVSIVVPTTKHHKISLDFLSHGINCLVEKPISFTIDEGKEMVKVAKENNVKLAIGHVETFNPAVVKAKKIIVDGIIGEIIHISTRRVGPFVSKILDVGIVVDVATHDIGVIRYLLEKEPTDIISKLRCIRNKKGDYAIILMDFDGISAVVEANWYTPHPLRDLNITGTKGVIHVDYRTQEIIVYTSEWELIPKVDEGEPLLLEIKHFVDCIKNDKIPLVSGEEGLKILEIAVEAEK